MNQSTATEITKYIFEKHFFSFKDWISSNLKLPDVFLRHPSEMSVVINDQRVLDFDFGSQPLRGKDGERSTIVVPKSPEAAYFSPGWTKGQIVSINTEQLASESSRALISEEALLEILVLHEMVHVYMIGYIGQYQSDHPWIRDSHLRYIHEAVALKASEFGLFEFIQRANEEDISKYIKYIQSESALRKGGVIYKPYYTEYQNLTLNEFWGHLRSSQPAPGIFEEVENFSAT